MKGVWSCFCFCLLQPGVPMPAWRWQAACQALGVLDVAACWRSLLVLLTMLSPRYGAPLLPGLPLLCFSQYQSAHISSLFQNPAASRAAVHSPCSQLVEDWVCTFGVPPGSRELADFCCCFPACPFELCNTYAL